MNVAMDTITCEMARWAETAQRVTQSLKEFGKLWEDRDKFHAIYPGEWPDKFALLNRFVRTDVRPPFIINE